MKYLRLGIPGSWLDDDARSELERVAREVLPFAIRQDHPRCFAFIPSAPTWPGVLAERPGTTYVRPWSSSSGSGGKNSRN